MTPPRAVILSGAKALCGLIGNHQGLIKKNAQTYTTQRLSKSRAGTPTDIGYADRFVDIFKLAVAERRSYQMLGYFLLRFEAIYGNIREANRGSTLI